MRPARLVTGTAASAVTIATLGLFTAGQPAYAGDAGTLRVGSAAAPRTNGGPEAQGGDGDNGDSPSGSGRDTPFGLNVPSLLDSVGGLNAFSGLNTPSRDEGSNERGSGNRNQSEDWGSGKHNSSSGRDSSSSGRDSSSSGRDNSSSGHDNSSSGRDNSSGRDSSSSSGRDNSSSGHSNSSSGRDSSSSGRDDSTVPTGPSGHVKTGVGGSVRSDTSQIAAGAGVLAAAAVGGTWLLRRRASGTQEAG
ncbi:hypothetical protein [Streptomyces sp. NPDC058092]|uniref:hypothetical protein n=1 Tax=Streptomyces sp. NPDC058092 TaxID=3346336 RepID=UPI0036E7B8C2